MPALPPGRHMDRVDTLEIKNQIVKKLGQIKASKYFSLLTRYLGQKISKSEFDKQCICTIGQENVHLHNHLLGSIIKNAHFSKTPPLKRRDYKDDGLSEVENGYQRSNLQLLCKDFPQSPRKGRTPNIRDRKIRDRLSPLHGKSHIITYEEPAIKIQEQQSATEFLSLGSRPPGSVEDGEEVEQVAGSPGIHSTNPLRAPFGIKMSARGTRKVLCNGTMSAYNTDSCYSSGELPDSSSLRKRLGKKLEIESLNVSVDCINLLNNSLDIFLKRLIKPCLEIADSISMPKAGHNIVRPGLNGTWTEGYIERPSRFAHVSLLDFRVAMESNPLILGNDWPTQFEKVCSCALEE